MTDPVPPQRSGRSWWLAAVALLAVGAVFWSCRPSAPGEEPVPADVAHQGDGAEVRRFCGTACHAYPPPDIFPRATWRFEVQQAYNLFRESDLQYKGFPSQEAVARYYEGRAPVELPLVKPPPATHALPVSFRRRDFPFPERAVAPAISHVNLVHLFDAHRLDVLACDMRQGLVLALQPYTAEPAWHVLYSHGPDRDFHPAHAEVVDLDRDGIADILVANLGNMTPTDAACGSVIWLRGLGGGRYEPHTLLQDVGRVADVQAADFRGSGRLDLVVAAFGWRHIGAVYYLENQSEDRKKPRFVVHPKDDRHGAIHVPVGDLDGDGKPDFAALISQEYETIVAFLNQGGGRFRKETVYTAPHPAYGSSSIELTDLDGDGRLDVLYSNGDTLDPPNLLRPYHSVQWLQNRGRFPFTHHPLTPLYGASRAVAADFTGRGKKDVAAVSFLAAGGFPQRKTLSLDAVILLEQAASGPAARHVIESTTCDHFSCAAGDVYGDGRMHLVVGSFSFAEGDRHIPAITIWENVGKGRR
jgi:hypothetical protein